MAAILFTWSLDQISSRSVEMMTLKLIVLAAAILSSSLVFGQDPTAQFRIDSMEMNTVANNPFFGEWSAEINSPGDIFTLKTPVKKTLPDSIRIKASFIYAGSPLPEIDIPICDGFDDVAFGQDVLASGIPKGVFPTACPIPANKDLEISKYKFPYMKLPPGVPSGSVICDVSVYEPGKEPYITLHAEGGLSHKLPGVGINF